MRAGGQMQQRSRGLRSPVHRSEHHSSQRPHHRLPTRLHQIGPPTEEWTQDVKHRLLAEQKLPDGVKDYELDHLVPPELGGAPRDPANLWLQHWDEARK